MISLYSGTPGSGKSYHAVYDILKRLKRKKRNTVIANFPLNLDVKYKDNFMYVDNSELTIDFLVNYAKKNNQPGVEGQTLVVIDEAQIIFNSREWSTNSKKRLDWVKFFSQHRKYGYNFILIAQFDRMIDRQIRCLIEYEIAHMKINNYFILLPFTLFLCVQRWYGQKMKLCHEIIRYSNKVAKCYNSYSTFDYTSITTAAGGDRFSGGAPAAVVKKNILVTNS